MGAAVMTPCEHAMSNKHQQVERDGMVKLDVEKLERARIRKGWSKAKLAEAADVHRGTVIRASRGKGVFASTATAIAESLDVDVDELQHAPEQNSGENSCGLPGTEEWNCEAALSPWIQAANGLQFRICRMRHRFDEFRQARGKFYDLLHVPTDLRSEMTDQLLRHSVVCTRVNPHPHIIDHLSCVPVSNGEGWWVVDRWFDAKTLAEFAGDQSLQRNQIRQIGCELLDALDVLHAADVVFRELAPSRILIDDESGRVVLTDFELAKLLGDAPSVSADWPDDVYRAPEVESGLCTPGCDYFSFARILLELLTGQLPPQGQDQELLLNAGLPKGLWKLLAGCLSPFADKRPARSTPLKRALSRWKV